MKTSTNRILTTHVGSIPRPESITTLLRARVSGQTIDEAQLAGRELSLVDRLAAHTCSEEGRDALRAGYAADVRRQDSIGAGLHPRLHCSARTSRRYGGGS